MKIWSEFSKIERRLIALALLLMAALLILLRFDHFFAKDASWFSSEEHEIGVVAEGQNDIRYKRRSGFSWVNSVPRQGLASGDSLFVGAGSAAQVQLAKGGSFHLGENSLITFARLKDEDVADLQRGNLRVKVHGEMRIAVRGRWTRVKGEHADIQIRSLKSQAPEIQVLSGDAEITVEQAEKPVRLAENQSWRIPEIPQETASESPSRLPAQENSTTASAPETQSSAPSETPSLPMIQPPDLLPDLKSAKMKHSPQRVEVAQVNSETVVPVAPSVPVTEELAPQRLLARFWVWAGAGISYLSNRQTTGVNLQGRFSGLRGPSQSLAVGGWVSEDWGVDFGFKTTPGEVLSSGALRVSNGDFQWRTLSLETLYRSSESWQWRLGLQEHGTPFIVSSDSQGASIVENQILMVSAGLQYNRMITSELRFEWLMRLQYPVSSRTNQLAEYQIQPGLHFDGSVGTVYEMGKNWRLGFFWYGQQQSFQFKSRWTEGAQSVEGQQDLFHSNFDLRIGYEF